MIRILRGASEEVAMLRWHENHRPDALIAFHDQSAALDFLRQLVSDPVNIGVLRDLLGHELVDTSLSGMEDQDLLEQLAWRLVHGHIRVVAASARPEPVIQAGISSPAATLPAEAEEASVIPAAAAAPQPVLPTVLPIITPATQIVVVKKPYTNPARKTVTLRTDSAFDGSGTLTCSSAAVRFFTTAVGGTAILFNGADNVFTGGQLTGGHTLYAEGASPSAALDDVQLTLTLTGGSKPVGPPATATMTSVEVTLDICMSRTAAGVDPVPLSSNDKINTGRFVHVQDPGTHQGRAMLIVRQAQPAAFAGALTLAPMDGRVRLFSAESPTAGEAPTPTPHVIANSAIPVDGVKLWAQGASVSGALRDTGFRLGIKDVENDGDRVAVTVVRLRRLEADILSTPAHTARLGNSPVARHMVRRGTQAALDATNYDEDFTANPPLVLLEGSVEAAAPIKLSVQIEPAGVPVAWSIQRDTRPAPDGDHADILALSPNAVPTLTPDAGDQLKATLPTDAVGSFHIRPYVDCNGNGQFDHNIDREPFIIMNLVLVRVTLQRDDSIARSANLTAAPAGGGINVSGGAFAIAAPHTAAIHLNAQADLVGGGGDGRRGLDRVFAGWANNESANEDIVATFQDTSVVPPVNRRSFSVFASNRGVAAGGTPASPIFLPGDAAPVLVAPPLLDTGRAAAGTGGDTACLTTSRIRTRSNLALGQRLRVEAVDSPGDGEGATHPGFAAGQLVRFRFGLNFRAYLCFWTNISRNSGATAHAANRLYSVLRQVNWRMRGEWSVTPATGAIAVVTAASAQITGRTTFSPLAAAVSTPVEVRPPTGLNLLARDARA